MRIIDRYITVEFLKVFAICIMGLILIFLLVELTDKIKLYFRYDPGAWAMTRYFLVKIPGYLFFALPLGILLGGMLSLLMMARRSELIAMQANGVDALSIARPVLIIGFAAGIVMFVANESVIPWSNGRSEEIQREIEGKRDTTFFKRNEVWLRSPDSITHIGEFDPANNTMEHVSMVVWNGDYNFLQRLFADKAKWWTDHWIFYGVNRTVRTPDGQYVVETVPSMTAPLKSTPEDFQRGERLAKEMNLTQLGEYINQLEQEGQRPDRYLVDWHEKIAFPFICLIMAALSVPFAIRVSPRAGGIAVGMAFSLVVAFGYYVVHTAFMALGHGGYIPAFTAAWAANVIFGLTATTLLLQAGT
ncbi:MAG: LPS export ABC transporter permease LptG [Desulfomonilaceae bacterium]|nr:LPS export ABC transporter permease LptG [Desulfomonilaceae bacterium]